MTKQEKDEIFKGLGALAIALDKEPSDTRNVLYMENLKDLPVNGILWAMKRAIQTCKFFPSIAELRELAGSGEDKQALEDRAALAWDNLRCLRRGYNPEALKCPITKKCWLALGGTNGFGVWDYYEQEQWKRKEFISLYLAFVRTGGRRQELTHEESTQVLRVLNVKEQV